MNDSMIRARWARLLVLVAALAGAVQPVAVHAQLPAMGDGGDLSLGAERRLGDRIARELFRDPDYLDDAVLSDYVQGLWQRLLAAARQRGDLADSPVGQAAWIYEKFQCWTDCQGEPERVLSRDEMLDNIMLYWLPDAAASSARLYWESWRGKPHAVDIPVAVSLFPLELSRPPRHWAEKLFSQIVYWNKVERGGHFAAFEQPALFVRELREAFRFLRVKA